MEGGYILIGHVTFGMDIDVLDFGVKMELLKEPLMIVLLIKYIYIRAIS